MAKKKRDADDALPEEADQTAKAEAKERAAAEERLLADARKSRRQIWSKSRETVFSKLLDTKSRVGRDATAILEPDGKAISYKDVVRGAFALGAAISRFTKRGENVGVLLPTSAGAVITLLALYVDGRVPAMLNFTAGDKALRSAVETARIKSVLTSRKFIEQGGLEGVVDALSAHARIRYLEDIKENLTGFQKLRAALGEKAPALLRRPMSPETPAVILFTSGTEGDPKGVVLNHQNLVANVEQIRGHVDLEAGDVCFNPLPVFHSYGLTAGCFFPLIEGKPLVPYPSPLHVKIIPEVIRKTNSTIIFATDTFLSRYLRAAKPGSMSSLRYAVCGAEKVRDETRNLARRLFGFSVLEGYGATECAPVLAVNQPGDIRPGTVGKLLPGVETKLIPVEGLEHGGRLLVRGPNVMAGYLDPETGKVVPPEDGWHDTGDVVTIDGGGYVAIKGRLKRFAKISGEMISLSVVENCASVVWPDSIHAAVVLPDDKKGEQIVLLTEEERPDRTALLDWAQSHGVPELAVPKRVLHLSDIPLLGTGKVDYVTLNQRAEELVAAAEAERQAAE
ncbi:AMP-binding protein [Parvularcula dongshanensis]|uniref:Acyl-[acyl-carrier-protein]-phospholipid O-acyltransferase/long-chain-fatty-acid--[acyl-carrier-protein] ligase n=1 Tax=Parvularcula dongshanensis TaxID=1173995 RepID=A0A840I1U5_9PROT|nr:AMP-binding protein [Parvularcula dongshanensis]MBB4658315.1 acyl-[acyl-carrier-protein]-phospholipid O-acyltransferase/long-chain-fatty-acid--[acyl-carrier-protein] ligase [Parvularcula dongshanensis]